MGILSRFRDIMTSNLNAHLERSDDPEKTVDAFMASANSDLGNIRAETASLLAEERRTKRALEECQDDIDKLQRYAEKAVAAGNDREAVKFLERKAPLAEKAAKLQAAHDEAAANVGKMQQMQDKLEADISQLEARRTKLKETMAAARNQQRVNAAGSPTGGNIDATLTAMEEKANRAYDEAMAIAELRAGTNNDLDEQLAQLEKRSPTTTIPEDEQAAIKAKMNKAT